MICENCGVEHEGLYGSGRFCNIKCARGFSTKAKRKEINEKVSKSFDIIHYEKRSIKKYCTFCNGEILTKRKRAKFCSRSCLAKNNWTKSDYRDRIISSIHQRLEDGTFSGWKERTKDSTSYAEKYFISVFENENIIGYERELKVNRYFIDFAFVDRMIAVEIDGKQHKELHRKESDQKKDEVLISLGWKVIRIEWYNPTTENNKNILYQQIKNLLEILRS